jgi:hypothetical protein
LRFPVLQNLIQKSNSLLLHFIYIYTHTQRETDGGSEIHPITLDWEWNAEVSEQKFFTNAFVKLLLNNTVKCTNRNFCHVLPYNFKLQFESLILYIYTTIRKGSRWEKLFCGVCLFVFNFLLVARMTIDLICIYEKHTHTHKHTHSHQIIHNKS